MTTESTDHNPTPSRPGQAEIMLIRDLFCRVDDAYGLMTSRGDIRTVREQLTDDLIEGHMEGRIRLGALFVDPEGMADQLAIDIDELIPELAGNVHRIFAELGIEAYIESSKGKGFHVRTHWEPPVTAAQLRRIGQFVVRKAEIPDAEVFPKQEKRREGDGVGSFMFLPMHGESVREGKTVFLDPENNLSPFVDQWEAIRNIRKNSLETLSSALSIAETEPLRDRPPKIDFPEHGESIPEGKRNVTFASLAGKMRRIGFPEESIHAALASYNKERCHPPLPENEVLGIAKSISKYPPAQNIGSSSMPVINAGDQNLPRATQEAWDAIVTANDPPKLFLHGGEPVRLELLPNGQPTLKSLTENRLRHEVARAAEWVKPKGRTQEDRSEKPAYPPMDVVRDMLASPNIPIPVLTAITGAPIFTPTGDLIVTPGHNRETGIYYAPAESFRVPLVPTRPTLADIDEAKNLLLFELLGDFPFIGETERAHAVALLLLPFVRELISGPTPLHLITKPMAGSGATLLSNILLYPSSGQWTAGMTEGRDEDEWRKRLTAALRNGAQAIFFDNLRKRLDSAAVASAITATVWSDRKLGTSDQIHVPVRATWVATGNNPPLSSEMSRRAIRIRIDPRRDQPWLGRNFRYPDLRQWVERNREHLVWAALTLVQSWLSAGRPIQPGSPTLGMFEKWSDIIGGILSHCGIHAFLGNLSDFYEEADEEGAEFRGFIADWWNQHKDKAVGVSVLFLIASAEDSTLQLGTGGEQSQRTKLGRLLGRIKDRHYQLSEGITLRVTKAGTASRAAQWQLVEVKE